MNRDFVEQRRAEIDGDLSPHRVPASTGSDQAASLFKMKSESRPAVNRPETPGEPEKFLSMFRPHRSQQASELAEKIGLSDPEKVADFSRMVEYFGENKSLHLFSCGYSFEQALLVEIGRLQGELSKVKADRDDKRGALEVMELRQQLRKPSEPEQPKAEALFRRSASRRQYQVSVS